LTGFRALCGSAFVSGRRLQSLYRDRAIFLELLIFSVKLSAASFVLILD
jgi:hypothetical protein